MSRLAAALLVGLALGCAVAADAARAVGVSPAEPVSSPPQLMLIHGGSFLYEDPIFQATTEASAIAAGFTPHYVQYPLGDLPGAIRAVRAAARDLRLRYGPSVYAYGSSAGGTLAAILAGEGQIAGAVAKAPPSDLVGWEWPLLAYGPAYYDRIAAGPTARYRFSPLRRPAARPLLIVHGRNDGVVPIEQSEAFAAKFRRVHLWAVPGGHHTEQARPWILEGAFRWLANLVAKTSVGRDRGPAEL